MSAQDPMRNGPAHKAPLDSRLRERAGARGVDWLPERGEAVRKPPQAHGGASGEPSRNPVATARLRHLSFSGREDFTKAL